MPSESEILTARLARMKQLLETLERECAMSAAQHQAFLKLQLDMESVRESLKLITEPTRR